VAENPRNATKNPDIIENYYIDIPTYWTKEDLLDLKDYLSNITL